MIFMTNNQKLAIKSGAQAIGPASSSFNHIRLPASHRPLVRLLPSWAGAATPNRCEFSGPTFWMWIQYSGPSLGTTCYGGTRVLGREGGRESHNARARVFFPTFIPHAT